MARTPDTDLSVPDVVVRYARTRRNGEVVINAWQLRAVGGLNDSEISRRLKVHRATLGQWFKAIEAQLEHEQSAAETKSTQPAPSHGVNAAILKANDVAQKRANLLARAEAEGNDVLVQKVLDSEQRRLGMDVQRVETTSLQLTLSLMPPAQRRAELMTRMRRMAMRGQLRPSELLAGVEEAMPGGPPLPGPSMRSLSPSNLPPTKISPDSKEAEDDESEAQSAALS